MISAIFVRSGGPPAAALMTSAASRKYCGPIAAGVITQRAFTPFVPLLSKRWMLNYSPLVNEVYCATM